MTPPTKAQKTVIMKPLIEDHHRGVLLDFEQAEQLFEKFLTNAHPGSSRGRAVMVLMIGRTEKTSRTPVSVVKRLKGRAAT